MSGVFLMDAVLLKAFQFCRCDNTSWLSIKSSEDVHLVIYIQLIWKRALSKHFFTQPPWLNCLYPQTVLLCNKVIDSTLLCSGSKHAWRLGTFCHIRHIATQNVTSYSVSFFLQMTQCFPSTAPHGDLSWHPGDCKSNLICIHLSATLKTWFLWQWKARNL